MCFDGGVLNVVTVPEEEALVGAKSLERGVWPWQLVSPYETVRWRRGDQITARCKYFLPHEAPYSTCHCGLYVHHDETCVITHGDTYKPVKVWGRQIVYRDGVRAQHAAIISRRAARKLKSTKTLVPMVDKVTA